MVNLLLPVGRPRVWIRIRAIQPSMAGELLATEKIAASYGYNRLYSGLHSVAHIHRSIGVVRSSDKELSSGWGLERFGAMGIHIPHIFPIKWGAVRSHLWHVLGARSTSTLFSWDGLLPFGEDVWHWG